jgi:very-short-patch-repair endonuclease
MEDIIKCVDDGLNLGKSLTEISKELDYPYMKLYKLCKPIFGARISMKVSCYSKSSKDWKENKQRKLGLDQIENIKHMYLVEKLNLQEIGKCFNMSASGILYNMKKFGIPSRSYSEATKLSHSKHPEIIEKFRQNANNGLVGIFRKGNNYQFTKIERDFQSWCIENQILFIRSFMIKKGTHRFDFYLPEYHLLVECDGKYWHSSKKQKEKDATHEMFALENSYDIIRFLDVDINFSKCKCFNIIKERNKNEFRKNVE